MLVWLTAQVDGNVLAGGLALAFATQTVIGWMKIESLKGTVQRLVDDVKDLDEDFDRLHPRQSNPGHRSHVEGDQHAEER